MLTRDQLRQAENYRRTYGDPRNGILPESVPACPSGVRRGNPIPYFERKKREESTIPPDDSDQE